MISKKKYDINKYQFVDLMHDQITLDFILRIETRASFSIFFHKLELKKKRHF